MTSTLDVGSVDMSQLLRHLVRRRLMSQYSPWSILLLKTPSTQIEIERKLSALEIVHASPL